jgi:hypothetical protein
MVKENVSSSTWNVSIVRTKQVKKTHTDRKTDTRVALRYRNVFSNAKIGFLLCIAYGSYRNLHGMPKSLKASILIRQNLYINPLSLFK